MLERQERVALVLLLGVVITLVCANLVLGYCGKQPFARPFTNNSADGELVIASGTISQLAITQNGGHMNVYTDTVNFFVPAQVAKEMTLQKGDTISVYGVVQTYHGKKEIVVSSVNDILVISGNTQK